MPGGPVRRSPSCWASRHARSATGSASTATRAWTSCAPCTTGVTPVGCGPLKSSGSDGRSPRGPSTMPTRCGPGSRSTSASPTPPPGRRTCCTGSAPATTKSPAFFWKADRDEQRRFVRKYRRQRREAGPRPRRYFVDACHPVWGLDLLYCCWLLVGQRHYVGVGNGRKRLNILGAYGPDDHDYVDLRLTKENITGEQFIKLLEKLRAKHPDTEEFLLYLDNAKYSSKPVVKEWLAAHREFRLVPLPAYSPNLNLIERLWKFLRKKALNRWHKTFEAMQAAVAEVLDHLGEYRDELATLMTERFAIVEVKELVA